MRMIDRDTKERDDEINDPHSVPFGLMHFKSLLGSDRLIMNASRWTENSVTHFQCPKSPVGYSAGLREGD
jgi:hypothetical protein